MSEIENRSIDWFSCPVPRHVTPLTFQFLSAVPLFLLSWVLFFFHFFHSFCWWKVTSSDFGAAWNFWARQEESWTYKRRVSFVVGSRSICSLNQLGKRYSENVFTKSQRRVCYFMHMLIDYLWADVRPVRLHFLLAKFSYVFLSLSLRLSPFVVLLQLPLHLLLLLLQIVQIFGYCVFFISILNVPMKKKKLALKCFLGRNDVWEYRMGQTVEIVSNIAVFIFSVAVLYSGHIVECISLYLATTKKKETIPLCLYRSCTLSVLVCRS